MKKFLVTSLVCFAMIGVTVPAYAHGHHGGGYGGGYGSSHCSVDNICGYFHDANNDGICDHYYDVNGDGICDYFYDDNADGICDHCHAWQTAQTAQVTVAQTTYTRRGCHHH